MKMKFKNYCVFCGDTLHLPYNKLCKKCRDKEVIININLNEEKFINQFKTFSREEILREIKVYGITINKQLYELELLNSISETI